MIHDNQDSSTRGSNKSFWVTVRGMLGVTAPQMAVLLGVPYQTFWSWENGRRETRLTIKQIKQLTRIMAQAGITWDDISDDATLNE